MKQTEKKYRDTPSIFSPNDYAVFSRHPLQRGLEALDRQDYENACQSFENAATHEPQNAVPYLFLGMALLALYRLPEAESAIEKGLALSPKNQLGQNLKSLILFKKNQPKEAVELLTRHPMIEEPRIQAMFLLEFEKILL